MQDFFEGFCEIFVSGRSGTEVTAKSITTGDTGDFLSLPVLAIDHPFDAVLQVQDIEVDE